MSLDTHTSEATQSSRQRVLQAAFELFVSQGYHGSSMRQVAKAAGMTPASIYNHFHSKEEIFREVLQQNHPYHQLLPILESAQGADAEITLRDVAERAYMAIRARQELLHLLFIEIVEFEGKHLGEIFAAVSPGVLSFLNGLETAQRQLRPISKSNVLLSLVGLVMSQWILEAVFIKNIKLPGADDHFEAALDIFLHGILANKEQNS